MDMDSLKLFSDVCKAGTITAAANRNYITQCSVSKRIAQLEKELGVTLFQRGKGRPQVVLTPAGKAFSDIAERMLLLYHQALDLQNGADRQVLTIACVNSVQGYTLPPFLLMLEQRYPKLCFTLEDHHTSEIFALLEDRRVDVGIGHVPSPSSNLRSVLLYQERYRVVMRTVPEGMEPGSTLHPGQLPAEHEIFEAFGDELELWHHRWWPVLGAKIRVNTTPTAEQYFHAPEDWMIVPASVAQVLEQKGFFSWALGGGAPVREVYAVYSRHTGNTAVQLFVEAAREYYSQSISKGSF